MSDETGSHNEARKSGETRNTVFLYKDSGISERHGHVPLWLWGVAVTMVIWSVYYMVVYWSPPPS